MASPYEPGTILGDRYQLLELLETGGGGCTYRGFDREAKTQVALKILAFHGAKEWKNIELFEREIQVLQTLNHDHIPRYLCHFQEEPEGELHYVLVQEFIHGQTLESLIEQGWQPGEQEIKDIARQVLDVLAYLHRLQPPIIHRDIKPGNLLRTADGKIYVVDFGTVKNLVRQEESFVSTFVGSVGYMPPEQLRGLAFPESDLYSLGMGLVFLLTKKCPADLPKKDLKIAFDKQTKIPISSGFKRWLVRLTEPILEDRFPSAIAAQEALMGKVSPQTPAPQTLESSLSLVKPSRSSGLKTRHHHHSQKITIKESDRLLLVHIDYSPRIRIDLKLDLAIQETLPFMPLLVLLPLAAYLILVLSGWILGTPMVFFLLLGGAIAAGSYDIGKTLDIEVNPQVCRITTTHLFFLSHTVVIPTRDVFELDNDGYLLKIWEGINCHQIPLVNPQRGDRQLPPEDVHWLGQELYGFIHKLQQSSFS